MHGIDYLQYKYMLYYCAMIGYAEMHHTSWYSQRDAFC